MRTIDIVLSELETSRGEDESARWELDPEAIFRFEPHSAIARLYVLWRRALFDGEAAPLSADFDTQAALMERDAKNLGLVNVRTFGEFQMIRPGTVYLEWEAVYDNAHERFCFESDLSSVIMWTRPAYHHIDQRIAGIRRRFSRIMLPVLGDEGRVVEIVTAENHEIMPLVVPVYRKR